MLSETVFQSEDLPVADRFDAWQALMSRTHAPMQMSSEDAADFRAHQRLIALGDVAVWPATFQQLVFRRTPKLVRQSDPENCHLSLLLRGNAVASWNRNEAAYSAYDLHINDTSLPFEIATGRGPITTIGIEVPKALLGLPWGSAQSVIGRRISARDGMGFLLAQFVSQLSADTRAYRPADAPRLGSVLAELVTALFAHALEAQDALAPETRDRTVTLGVKDFIRRRLHDCELTPSAIAAAHHISRGHLHRLFQAEGTTVASYIRDQRLEAARRELADPAQAATPVHVIAARWGFKDHTTFTRTFRTAYGAPPRDFRRRPPDPRRTHG
ncbi:helix-turn-helix domain-containing protein [Streptomyces sp. V4-01]|uniref:Helix-turn-helix domain-containing protein n=1 Tax=Actinacidiphila polyblastidii TaxID=3110430 RepID=A0ABU7P3U8_9ACTN|nr:helix-turn-helix domain-containing protein [Streptomyces sp. V4-01]